MFFWVFLISTFLGRMAYAQNLDCPKGAQLVIDEKKDLKFLECKTPDGKNYGGIATYLENKLILKGQFNQSGKKDGTWTNKSTAGTAIQDIEYQDGVTHYVTNYDTAGSKVGFQDYQNQLFIKYASGEDKRLLSIEKIGEGIEILFHPNGKVKRVKYSPDTSAKPQSTTGQKDEYGNEIFSQEDLDSVYVIFEFDEDGNPSPKNPEKSLILSDRVFESRDFKFEWNKNLVFPTEKKEESLTLICHEEPFLREVVSLAQESKMITEGVFPTEEKSSLDFSKVSSFNFKSTNPVVINPVLWPFDWSFVDYTWSGSYSFNPQL
ncbi:MAG: hypothetical protein KBD63_01940 [Bacteriovoracaceae bacterium]|nr:hypothetical protein [Bacteriovoracaceae bacterium]